MPLGPNLLADGGFESGLTGWTCPGAPTWHAFDRVTASPHSGTYNLKNEITSAFYTGGFYYTYTGLTVGELYRLKGWYRTANNPSMYVQDSSGTPYDYNGNYRRIYGNPTTWTEFSYDFVCVASTGYLLFGPDALSTSLPGGIIELDDLELIPFPAEDYSPNLIVDPGFEGGIDEWSIASGTPDLTVNTTEARSGAQAMQFIMAMPDIWFNRLEYFASGLEVGQTYRYSIWASEPAAATFGQGFQLGVDGVDFPDVGMFVLPATGWGYYYVDFVAAVTNPVLSIYFGGAGAGSGTNFDDVYLGRDLGTPVGAITASMDIADAPAVYVGPVYGTGAIDMPVDVSDLEGTITGTLGATGSIDIPIETTDLTPPWGVFDFELGVGGWTAPGTSTISIETANPGAGDQSMRVENADVNPRQAQYTLTGLTPGKEYVFQYKQAYEGSCQFVYSYVIVNGSYLNGAPFANDGTWVTTDVYTFVAPAASTVIEFNAHGYGTPSMASGEAFLFDDLVIAEYTGVVEDFEPYAIDSTPSRFFGTGTVQTTNEEAHAGAQSAWVANTASPGRVFQDGPVTWSPIVPAHKWGRDFTFSAWVWVPTGTNPAKIGVTWSATSAGGAADPIVTTTSTLFDTWEQLTVSLTNEMLETYGPLNWGTFVFSGDDDAAAFGYYVDDVVLAFDDEGPWDGNIRSDDLEEYAVIADATTNWWNATGDADIPVIDLEATIVHSGTQSMSISFPAAVPGNMWNMPRVGSYVIGLETAVDGVDVEPSASIWVYVPTGSSPIMLYTYDDWDTGDILQSDTSTLFDTWEQLTITVPIAGYFMTYGNVWVGPSNPLIDGSIAYIDDLSISAISPPPNVDIPIEVAALTGGIIGPNVAEGALDAPVSMAADPVLLGLIAADGEIDVPSQITANATVEFEELWTPSECTLLYTAPGVFEIHSPVSPAAASELAYVQRIYTGLTPGALYEFDWYVEGISPVLEVEIYVAQGTDGSHWRNDANGNTVFSMDDGRNVFFRAFAYSSVIVARLYLSPTPVIVDDGWDPFLNVVMRFTDQGFTEIPEIVEIDGATAPLSISGGWGGTMSTWPAASVAPGVAIVGTEVIFLAFAGDQPAGWSVGYTPDIGQSDTLPLPPGVTVTVGAWVWVPAGSPPAVLWHYRSTSEYLGPRVEAVSVTEDAWEYLEITMDSDLFPFGRFGPQIGTSDGSVASGLYIDGMSITWAGVPGSLALTDDFEDDIVGETRFFNDVAWQHNSGLNAFIVASDAEAHSGTVSQSLEVAEGDYVWVELLPNTMRPGYGLIASVWVFVPTGLDGVRFSAAGYYDDFGVFDPALVKYYSADSTVTGAWEQLTVIVPADELHQARVNQLVFERLGPTTGDDIFYIDDFQLSQFVSDVGITVPLALEGAGTLTGTLGATGSLDILSDLTADPTMAFVDHWAGYGGATIAYVSNDGAEEVFDVISPVTPAAAPEFAYVERTYTGLTPGTMYEVNWIMQGNTPGSTSIIHIGRGFNGSSWRADWAGFGLGCESGYTAPDMHVFAYSETMNVRIFFTPDPTFLLGSDPFLDVIVRITDQGVVPVTSYDTPDAYPFPFLLGGYLEGTWENPAVLASGEAPGTAISGTDIQKVTFDGTAAAGVFQGAHHTIGELDNVPLVPGVTYSVSVWVWVPTGAPPACLRQDSADPIFVGTYNEVLSTTNDAWEELVLVLDNDAFLNRARGSWPKISVGTSDGDVASTLYLDAETITWTGVPDPLDLTRDFEDLVVGQNRYANQLNWTSTTGLDAAIISSSDHARSGTKSLKLTVNAGANEFICAHINPVFLYAGVDVRATVWVYVPTGAVGVRLSTFDYNSGAEIFDAPADETTTFDTWEMLSIIVPYDGFTIYENGGVSGVALKSMSSASSVIFYADDFSLVQTVGGITVPVEITADAHIAYAGDGSLDIATELDAAISITYLATGTMDVPANIAGHLRSLTRLPAPPAPAPPEELGVFPMPEFGGVTVRALYGKTVTMDAPTITDGVPSS